MQDAEKRRLLPKRTTRSAIDSSGCQAYDVGHRFVRRRTWDRDRTPRTVTHRRFPKVALLIACPAHLIPAAVVGRGPGPDHAHLIKAVLAARERRVPETLLADAGYDAEWGHQFLRDELDVRALIPPGIGRRTAKPPTGRQRCPLRRYFQRPERRRTFASLLTHLLPPQSIFTEGLLVGQDPSQTQDTE
jgi:hypothetical protein